MHYDWFPEDQDNSKSECAIKQKTVFVEDVVCEEFILHCGVHTSKEIPDYCKHYQNKDK